MPFLVAHVSWNREFDRYVISFKRLTSYWGSAGGFREHGNESCDGDGVGLRKHGGGASQPAREVRGHLESEQVQ